MNINQYDIFLGSLMLSFSSMLAYLAFAQNDYLFSILFAAFAVGQIYDFVYNQYDNEYEEHYNHAVDRIEDLKPYKKIVKQLDLENEVVDFKIRNGETVEMKVQE